MAIVPMITRSIATALLGFALFGYAPRWLATGQAAWIIWLAAGLVVFAGPRLLRHGIGRLGRRVRRARGTALRRT